MKNLLYIKKPGCRGAWREKNNLYAYLRCFLLSSILFCITVFSPGCGNEFSALMDTPQKEGTTSAPVMGVNLNKTTSTTNIGGTIQLNPTIIPSNATNKNVTWLSDTTGVATVSSSGLVTGVAAGNATITVKTADGNYTATCVVIVSPVTVAVTGVSLDKTTSNINVGGTAQLNPTIIPSNATNQNVIWSSDTTGVATVSSSGLVTGVAAGNATITVKTADGNHTATCVVTVSTVTVAVTGVSLDKTASSIDVGGTVQLNPTIIPPNATNQNVIWSSDATGIATVSSSGLVTGVAAGPATITVKTADGNYTATCSVTVTTVTVAVTGVNLNKAISTIYIGETVQLIPEIIPSNATNQNVTWSSNATGYATVSSSGLVTGVALGPATITIKTADGNYTATCAVTVANAIYWTENDKTINKIYTDKTGETTLLTVSGTPLDIALHKSAKMIYWTEYTGSAYQIRKSGTDGSSTALFAEYTAGGNRFGPTAIAIDSGNAKIYFNYNDNTSKEYIYYSSLSSFSAMEWTQNVPKTYVYSICLNTTNIYFNANSYWDIYSTTIGSGNTGDACRGTTAVPNSHSTPLNNETGPLADSTPLRGMAVDAGEDHIYYVLNTSAGLKIIQARSDFQEKTDWITAGSFGIQKIALDLNKRKIYWTSDQSPYWIYRADLDIPNKDIEQYIPLGSKPTGIAITQ